MRFILIFRMRVVYFLINRASTFFINLRFCLVGALRVVRIIYVPTALRTFIVLNFGHFSDRFRRIRVIRYNRVSLFLTRLRSFWSLRCYRKARESAARNIYISITITDDLPQERGSDAKSSYPLCMDTNAD